jgi:pyruvate formate lyase activating enzyme
MADFLGLCPNCARTQAAEPYARQAHARSRALFDLPPRPPRSADSVHCQLCGCSCQIAEGERGFCGLRTVSNGKIRHAAGIPAKGLLHWYRDPLPTNCVADWVCSGSEQYGSHNLAVFYKSCTLDCLYCQNWHFREADAKNSPGLSAHALADAANRQTYCVCYFGGDPASQLPHALASAHQLSKRGVVVCWETAGTANPKLMDRAVRLSLETGGCVKFDLKAFSESLHISLTGWTNRQTLENFSRAAGYVRERPDPPLLVASTLLVPGYVNVGEVEAIAGFIAAHDPDIPYALLGFGPNYLMPDLPTTSVGHAEEAYQAAKEAGLRRVRIGNQHLLSRDY